MRCRSPFKSTSFRLDLKKVSFCFRGDYCCMALVSFIILLQLEKKTHKNSGLLSWNLTKHFTILQPPRSFNKKFMWPRTANQDMVLLKKCPSGSNVQLTWGWAFLPNIFPSRSSFSDPCVRVLRGLVVVVEQVLFTIHDFSPSFFARTSQTHLLLYGLSDFPFLSLSLSLFKARRLVLQIRTA